MSDKERLRRLEGWRVWTGFAGLSFGRLVLLLLWIRLEHTGRSPQGSRSNGQAALAAHEIGGLESVRVPYHNDYEAEAWAVLLGNGRGHAAHKNHFALQTLLKHRLSKSS